MFAFFGPCSSSMLQSHIKPCTGFTELIVMIDPGMFSAGCQGHLNWRYWLHKQGIFTWSFLMFLFDQVQFGARGGCKRPGGTPWHAANVFARALVPCGLFCAPKTSMYPAKTQT